MATSLELQGALVHSNQQYRRECIVMPQAVLADTLKYVTPVYYLHGKETTPMIRSTAHFKPYVANSYDTTNTTTISCNTLETKLCELCEEFDPYQIYTSIFNEPLKKKRIDGELVKKVSVEISRSACNGLQEAVWSGKRVEGGSNNLDCVDGFDQIIKDAKASSKITLALKNYKQLGRCDESNIGDKFRWLWMCLDPKLKKAKKLYFYLPNNYREMYENWHATNYGTAQFQGGEFTQQYLHGTNKRCEFVSLIGMENLDHIIITTKENLAIGFDGDENGTEEFRIREVSNPKVVQVFQTTFIGCQIRNFEKEFFCCASMQGVMDVPYVEVDQESVDFGDIVSGDDDTIDVKVEGFNLTSSLTVAVSGSGFSTVTSTITAANANAADGVNVAVKYDPAATGTHTGKLTITSITDSVDIEIPLSGKCVVS